MPLYSYKCETCGHTEDAFRRISERLDGPICHDKMKLMIVPVMIQPVLGGGSFQGYKCPITDQFVTSRKQRKEIMKSHGLEEKG